MLIKIRCTVLIKLIKGGIVIKKYIPILLFCIILILSACTQSVEDTQDYSGIIAERKAMGYEYTVTKEDDSFSWQIGYKGDLTTIEESIGNKDELQSFMRAVSDSKLILSKLIISLLYFLIVAVISFFLYKKNCISQLKIEPQRNLILSHF